MPQWVEAGLWGLAGGESLVAGALVAWFLHVPRDVVAVVMAFGAGVLTAAAAFELTDQAERNGGLPATSAGLLGGAGPGIASAAATSPSWRNDWVRSLARVPWQR